MVRLQNTRCMTLLAILVIGIDQVTKLAVLRYLGYADERVVVDGFFKFVHWVNTGAAWSLFNRSAWSNEILALFAIAALCVLFLSRHHFDAHTLTGQVSLGLIFGGIAGNLIDRFVRKHVIDFLYFYFERRGGGELGFPAFNVADAAICSGVGLLLLLSWQRDRNGKAPGGPAPKPA